MLFIFQRFSWRWLWTQYGSGNPELSRKLSGTGHYYLGCEVRHHGRPVDSTKNKHLNGINTSIEMSKKNHRFAHNPRNLSIKQPLFAAFFGQFNPSWYGRPNPEDRINRKPKDRIFDRRTELIENRRTEFVHMTESVTPVIPTFYIRAYLCQLLNSFH